MELEWMELLNEFGTERLFEMLTQENREAVICQIEKLLALQSSDR